MWIFTKSGFLSVVADLDNDADDVLIVRARRHGDLVDLVGVAQGLAQRSKRAAAAALKREIVHVPGADYEFRAYVDREAFATWLVRQVDAIDYGNFKEAAHAADGDPNWSHALHHVWSIVRRIHRPGWVPASRYTTAQRVGVR